MRAHQVAERLRREQVQARRLTEAVLQARRRGEDRHSALDAWVARNSARIDTLEDSVADLSLRLSSLEVALAAHVADTKRHTGKV